MDPKRCVYCACWTGWFWCLEPRKSHMLGNVSAPGELGLLVTPLKASVDAALHGPSDLGVYSRPSASSTPDTWAPRPVPDQTGHTPAPGPLHLLLPRPGINTRLTSFRSLLKRHLVSAAFRGHQCHTPLPGLPSSLLHLSSSFSTRQRMTFQKIKLIMSVSCLKTCLGPHFL